MFALRTIALVVFLAGVIPGAVRAQAPSPGSSAGVSRLTAAAPAARPAAPAPAPPPGASSASVAHAPAETLPPLLIGARTAKEAGLCVGDSVRLSSDPALRGAVTYRVAGIVPVKADPVDIGRGTRYVKLHFSDFAALTAREDEADEVILKARTPAGAELLRDRLNALGTTYHAYTSEELARRSSGPFEVISQFHKAISLITLVAGAIFLLAILLFKVEERRRELGALRLIGISRLSLLLFLCSEAVAIALVGSGAGLGLGWLGAAGVNAWYQRYYQTTLTFAALNSEVAWISLLLGAGFGLAAGVVVAVRVVRTPALELLGR